MDSRLRGNDVTLRRAAGDEGSLLILDFTSCDKLQGSFAALRMTWRASLYDFNFSYRTNECGHPIE